MISMFQHAIFVGNNAAMLFIGPNATNRPTDRLYLKTQNLHIMREIWILPKTFHISENFCYNTILIYLCMCMVCFCR